MNEFKWDPLDMNDVFAMDDVDNIDHVEVVEVQPLDVQESIPTALWNKLTSLERDALTHWPTLHRIYLHYMDKLHGVICLNTAVTTLLEGFVMVVPSQELLALDAGVWQSLNVTHRALHFTDHPSLLRNLIASVGANRNAMSGCLAHAVLLRDAELIQRLLDRGAFPVPDFGCSALHAVVQLHCEEDEDECPEKNSEGDKGDERGQGGNLRLRELRELLAKFDLRSAVNQELHVFPPGDDEYCTPLSMLCANLEDISESESESASPSSYSSSHSYASRKLDLLEWLIEQGANPNYPREVPAFAVCCGKKSRYHIALVQRWLENGNPDTLSLGMIHAARAGNVEVLRILETTGHPIPMAALGEAVHADQLVALQFLLDRAPEHVNGDYSLLDAAFAHGNACMIQLLLQRGARIFKPDHFVAPVIRDIVRRTVRDVYMTECSARLGDDISMGIVQSYIACALHCRICWLDLVTDECFLWDKVENHHTPRASRRRKITLSMPCPLH